MQWELRRAVARRNQSHVLGFLLNPGPSAEISFGRTPSHLSAIPPLRGLRGEGPMDLPIRVDYLDAERMPPALVRKAA